MGTQMRFPHSADAYLEWEDVEFTDKLLYTLLGVHPLDQLGPFFMSYVAKRGDGLWGVKSPFLIPYIRMFERACQLEGHQFKLISTERPYHDTIASLRHQFDDDEAFKFAKRIQDKLEMSYRFLKTQSNLNITLEDLHVNHSKVDQDITEFIRRVA